MSLASTQPLSLLANSVLETVGTFAACSRVLDLGAGASTIAALTAPKVALYVALDLHPDSPRSESLSPVVADLNNTQPFRPNTFDVVLCTEVIEHVENPYALLRQCSAALVPNGLLVLTTPNVTSIPSRLRFLFTGFTKGNKRPLSEEHRSPHDHLTPMPYWRLRHALIHTGFRLQSVTAVQPIVRASITRICRPIVSACTHRALSRERDVVQREKNRDIAHDLATTALLGARTLLVLARKKGSAL